jgi:F-type H+-transporting ATPase subunit alpha
LPAYRKVVGDLRLFYSQFEELEIFSRFGSRLDEHTKQTLARGRAVREALKQPQYDPLSPAEQIVVLLAATQGLFDNLPPDRIAEASRRLRHALPEQLPALKESIEQGEQLTDADRRAILKLVETVLSTVSGTERGGSPGIQSGGSGPLGHASTRT